MEVSIAQLHFMEAEVMCRLFADQFSLPVDDVLRVGLTKVLDEYPLLKKQILPTHDSVRKLNLPGLRDELRARNLKLSGSKKELQMRLMDELDRVQNLITQQSKGNDQSIPVDLA